MKGARSAPSPGPSLFRLARTRLVDIRIERWSSSDARSVRRGIDPEARDVGLLLLHVAGASASRVDGVAERDEPGSVRILRPDSVVETVNAQPTERMLVAAPLAALSATSANVLRRRWADAPRISPSPMVLALAALAGSALDTPVHPASADAYVAERALITLLDAVLSDAELGSAATEGSGFAEHLHARALSCIDRGHTDPDFAAEQVADGTGVSLRSLQRIFAEHGGSVSQAIRERRLAAVAAALDSGSSDDLADVIRAAGFTVADSARRAFLAEYGMTMSNYRRRPRS
ncbi:helix-turn-helix domain-containing protein [Microbacteriaceae bacterium VKM Ac-2854]|nr:helix-turn-helix domain-containing protein [Microbacteriaceae bacterium VKM Ac-2854]